MVSGDLSAEKDRYLQVIAVSRQVCDECSGSRLAFTRLKLS